MQHVEFFCGIPPSVQQDRLLSSRMIWEELRDIKDLTVHYDPTVVLLVVFRYLLLGEGLGTCLLRRR